MFTRRLKEKVQAAVFLLMLTSVISCRNDIVSNNVIDNNNVDITDDDNVIGVVPAGRNPDKDGNYSLLRAVHDVLDIKEAYKASGLKVYDQDLYTGYFDPDPKGPNKFAYRKEIESQERLLGKHIEGYDLTFTVFNFYNFPHLLFWYTVMDILRNTGHYRFVKLPEEEAFQGLVNEEAVGPKGEVLRFNTEADMLRAALLADLYRGLSAETITAMFEDPADLTARGIIPVSSRPGGRYAFPAWPLSQEFNEYQVFYFFDNSAQRNLTNAAKNDVLTQMQKWETKLNQGRGSSAARIVFVDVQSAGGLIKYRHHLENTAFGNARVLPVKISAFTPDTTTVAGLGGSYAHPIGPYTEDYPFTHPYIETPQAGWNDWFQSSIPPKLQISTLIDGQRRLITTLHELGHMLGLQEEYYHPTATEYIDAPGFGGFYTDYPVVNAGGIAYGFIIHDSTPGRLPHYELTTVGHANAGEYINATPLVGTGSIMLLNNYERMMQGLMTIKKQQPGGHGVGYVILPQNNISESDKTTVWLNHLNRTAHNVW